MMFWRLKRGIQLIPVLLLLVLTGCSGGGKGGGISQPLLINIGKFFFTAFIEENMNKNNLHCEADDAATPGENPCFEYIATTLAVEVDPLTPPSTIQTITITSRDESRPTHKGLSIILLVETSTIPFTPLGANAINRFSYIPDTESLTLFEEDPDRIQPMLADTATAPCPPGGIGGKATIVGFTHDPVANTLEVTFTVECAIPRDAGNTWNNASIGCDCATFLTKNAVNNFQTARFAPGTMGHFLVPYENGQVFP